MSLDKFGRYHHLHHHPNLYEELYGFFNITIVGNYDPILKNITLTNGEQFYKFPIESGTVSHIFIFPGNLELFVNAKLISIIELMNGYIFSFGDKISIKHVTAPHIFVEFTIKYPIRRTS